MGANKTSFTGQRPATPRDWDFSGVRGGAPGPPAPAQKRFHWPPSRGLIAAFVAIVALLLAAFFYDRSNSDKIREGVTVAGVDVGGMDRDQAADALRAELAPKLQRSVRVRAAGKSFNLTPREASLRLDTDGMVDAAIAESRSGVLPVRVYKDVTGASADASLPSRVDYSDVAVRRFASKVKSQVDREPVDAKVDFQTADLPVVQSQEGLRVNAPSLRRSLVAALGSTTDRSVRPRIRTTDPDVTSSDLAPKYPTVITVDRSNFQLRLFKDLELSKTYKIAVGQAGLDTPAGLYNVQNKAVDPAWHVPNSDWAGDLAGKVIPGGAPDNPLKARWMGIFDGAGIHGTAEEASLGSAASHGCIRMRVSDVKELYDEVPVGAPVYIQ